MERKSKKSQELDANAVVKKTPWWKFGEKRKVRKLNRKTRSRGPIA